MLRHIKVRDMGCVRSADLTLTPLHALIGPNDSGKRTLLRAVDVAYARSEFVHEIERGEASETHGPEPGALRGVRHVRFDAAALREPCELLGCHLPSGKGLAGILAQLSGEDLAAVEARMRAAFPWSASLQAVLASGVPYQTRLAVRQVDGALRDASELSAGLLYFLGFAVLPCLRPVALLLVEEPERGLHPARIADIVAILRSVVERGTQVVLTTHSPLVVNELAGDEVTLVTRTPAEGTRAQLLKDVPFFERSQGVYQPGEFWLSLLIDGADEA